MYSTRKQLGALKFSLNYYPTSVALLIKQDVVHTHTWETGPCGLSLSFTRVEDTFQYIILRVGSLGICLSISSKEMVRRYLCLNSEWFDLRSLTCNSIESGSVCPH